MDQAIELDFDIDEPAAMELGDEVVTTTETTDAVKNVVRNYVDLSNPNL